MPGVICILFYEPGFVENRIEDIYIYIYILFSSKDKTVFLPDYDYAREEAVWLRKRWESQRGTSGLVGGWTEVRDSIHKLQFT